MGFGLVLLVLVMAGIGVPLLLGKDQTTTRLIADEISGKNRSNP